MGGLLFGRHRWLRCGYGEVDRVRWRVGCRGCAAVVWQQRLASRSLDSSRLEGLDRPSEIRGIIELSRVFCLAASIVSKPALSRLWSQSLAQSQQHRRSYLRQALQSYTKRRLLCVTGSGTSLQYIGKRTSWMLFCVLYFRSRLLLLKRFLDCRRPRFLGSLHGLTSKVELVTARWPNCFIWVSSFVDL